MNTNSIPQLGSLLPVNLKEEIQDPLTPWSISEELFGRLKNTASAAQSDAYRKVIVLPTDPEWRFVWKYFSHDLPNRYMIKSIFCVHNRDQTRAFEVQLRNQDREASTFPPNWSQETNSDLRNKIISRWQSSAEHFSPITTKEEDGRRYQWNSVKVLPVWHGTKKDICHSVSNSGFVFFGKKSIGSKQKGDPASKDPGYFGSGIYFTNSARYAADIYSEGHLLLSWVSMREPFPVVDGDIATLMGSTAYKQYNAHYIPVCGVNPTNLYESVYYPCKRNEESHCDELVVFHSSQTLPRFWVELEVMNLYLKKISNTPQFVEDLIPHLFKIMQNQAVDRDKKIRLIFSTFLATLLQQDQLDDLDEDQLQFYQLMSKLLNSSGKIDQAVRTKLIQPTKAIFLPSLEIPKDNSQLNIDAFSADVKQLSQKELEAEYDLGMKFLHGAGLQKNEEEAARHFKLAAEEGYVQAQYALGLMYADGTGVKKDKVEAVRLYTLAANQGDPKAQIYLGVMYAHGTGVKKDEVEAVRLLKLAANQGYADAQFCLGVMYAKGTGVKKDEAEAVRLYTLAANQGDAVAQINLGGMYKEGRGVTKDEAEAVRLYTLAVNQEHAKAQINLGLMYEEGRGVKKDEAEAVRLYTLAANQGDALAQYVLGLMYENGTGVKNDEAEAVRLYTLAASQGLAQAQYALGLMYAKGTGVKKDEAEALRLYTLASNQGYAPAQYNLGVRYANGIGVKKDEAEAVRFYTLAANQGYGTAQYNLGLKYEKGRGVKKDEAEAARYYRLAVEQRDADARKQLEAMGKK